jgi:hypothetical protein
MLYLRYILCTCFRMPKPACNINSRFHEIPMVLKDSICCKHQNTNFCHATLSGSPSPQALKFSSELILVGAGHVSKHLREQSYQYRCRSGSIQASASPTLNPTGGLSSCLSRQWHTQWHDWIDALRKLARYQQDNVALIVFVPSLISEFGEAWLRYSSTSET